MDEERDLDAVAVRERRLALAVALLGWGPERVAGFRDGHASAGSDRARLHLHRADDGFDEARLPPAARDALGYAEGAAGREAEAAAPSDLVGADELVLMEQAAFWADNGDGDFEVDEAGWRCEAALGLEPFLAIMDREAWVAWFVDEHRAAVDAGRPGYADLLIQDIRDPVVYVEHPDGRIDVWDGYHRIGAAMAKGAGAVPALVGTPPGPVPAP